MRQDDFVVFTNVNIIPMDREQVLRNQVVVVHQGRISRIEEEAEISIPAGSAMVDGRGRFLMPGLADMHTHTWGEADFLLFITNGVTTIRNMWGSRRQLAWRARIDSGDLLGPTIFTAGPLIDGSPPIWNTSKVVVTREEADAEVAREKKLGYDFVKVYNRLSLEAYQAIVNSAKKLGMDVAGHVPHAVGLEAALEAGQDSIEHLEGYIFAMQSDDSPVKDKPLDMPSRRRVVDFVDEGKIPGIVAATLAAGTWNCVTLTVTRKFVSAEDAKKLLEDSRMRFVPPEWLASWDPSKDFRLKTMTTGDFERLRRGDAIKSNLTRKLHEAGCKILLGTDTPNPFMIPGFSIHEELRNLVEAGLSPYDAIRAGTADAAEFLGASDEFGTVEVGKRADLILVENNPLEGVGTISNPLGVMAHGRWYPREELARMLEEQVATYVVTEGRLDSLFEGLPGETYSSYLVKSAETLLGKERISLERHPEGRLVINSQALTNVPPRINSTLLRLELGRDSAPVSLSFVGKTSEGTKIVNMTYHEGTVRIAGSQPGEPNLRMEMSEPPGILLGSPHIASYLPVVRELQSMEVGQALEIRMLRLEVSPELDFAEARLQFARDPDIEEPSKDARQSRLAVFSVTETRNNASITGRFLLDSLGRLVRFERDEQMGLTRFELALR